MKTSKAATALGIEEKEISAVDDVPSGTVVTTTDGARTIILEDGSLALFGRPDGRDPDDPKSPPYAFAVHRPTDADREALGEEVEHVAEPVVPADPDDGGAVRTNEQAPAPPGPPRKNASLAAWLEFAAAEGADPAELEGLSRDDLAARFGPQV
jgi:hypothetical protein